MNILKYRIHTKHINEFEFELKPFELGVVFFLHLLNNNNNNNIYLNSDIHRSSIDYKYICTHV